MNEYLTYYNIRLSDSNAKVNAAYNYRSMTSS